MEKEDVKQQQKPGRKALHISYTAPAIVLLLGLISIALLIWNNGIGKRQRQNFAVADAIMDFRIEITTSHLWLEEAIAGAKGVDIPEVWAGFDRGIQLAETILRGGEGEHGMMFKPLEDPGTGREIEIARQRMVRLKAMALERWEKYRDGIDLLRDVEFNAAFVEFMKAADAVENSVELDIIAQQRKSERIFVVMLLVWASILAAATIGLRNREVRRTAAERALRVAHEQLGVKAEELDKHRSHLTELVAERTADLAGANKKLQEVIILHQRTEKTLLESERQLRYLSSQLLIVQENERKRISRELHDELGQALMVLKFQLDRLSKEKKGTRAELRALPHYLDEVIENVRRLSRDLSPASLEQFGLSFAINNLLEEFGQHFDIRWSPDQTGGLDHLFSHLAQLNTFRIFQESLTNIGRHAHASRISVNIEQQEDHVLFTVEDDGLGFDSKNVSDREHQACGIGLATMQERARLSGGSLDILSQPGAGTKITFRIPTDKASR
jgi:signal transduction histidine kinase